MGKTFCLNIFPRLPTTTALHFELRIILVQIFENIQMQLIGYSPRGPGSWLIGR